MHICEVEYKNGLQRRTMQNSISEQHNAVYCYVAFGALTHGGHSIVGGGRDIVTSILPIQAADRFIVVYLRSIPVRISKMPGQKLLTLR